MVRTLSLALHILPIFSFSILLTFSHDISVLEHIFSTHSLYPHIPVSLLSLNTRNSSSLRRHSNHFHSTSVANRMVKRMLVKSTCMLTGFTFRSYRIVVINAL